jgi:cytochrome c oxidase cbb3-type subunit III
MPNRLWLAVILLTAVAAAGCASKAAEPAAAGGAPALNAVAIGPIPGPATASGEPTDPYATNAVALMQGRQLFVQYNCYGCHGGHAGGGMGPSLRDEAWIYGKSDAHVFDSIARGRGKGMPAWGTKLPQDQIWRLVAYVKSLRTPLEPEPPEK